MIQKKIIIKNKLGMHARPAALLVQTAAKFKSTVFITKDDKKIDAKSIIGIMTLAAEYNSELKITINGPEEMKAFTAIADLIDKKFFEE